MAEQEELWLPLVDEPISAIVGEIEEEQPEIRALVDTPEKLLAFRTFACIRVGVLLGRLLMESEVAEADGSENWMQAILRDPARREEIVAEVRAVAEELSSGDDEQSVGPDDAARARFRAFAERELS